jgi:hypothetical protein
MRSVSPSITWIHDREGQRADHPGNAPRGQQVGDPGDRLRHHQLLDARVSYRTFLNKGNDADRFSDRDFVSLAIHTGGSSRRAPRRSQ